MSADVAYTDADERAWDAWNALNGGGLTLAHREGFDEGYQRGRAELEEECGRLVDIVLAEYERSESAEAKLEAVRGWAEKHQRRYWHGLTQNAARMVLAIIESGGDDGE